METSLVSPKIYCKYGDVSGVSKNLVQIWRRPWCLQKFMANMETSLVSPKIYCKYGDVPGVSKILLQIWRRPRCLQKLSANMSRPRCLQKFIANMETSQVSPKSYYKYGDVPDVSKNLLQIWRRPRCLQKLSPNMETSRRLQKFIANMVTSNVSPKT